MKHCIIALMLCIVSSVFFTSSDCRQLAGSAHNDPGTHAASDHEYQLTNPGVVLPRKLKFREDQLASVKRLHNAGDQDLSTRNAKKNAFSAGNKEITKKKNAPIRTWREWVEDERSDTAQYFTMDYSHVRRPRPIHSLIKNANRS